VADPGGVRCRAGRYGLRGGPGGVAWCVSGRGYAPPSDTPRGVFPNSLMSTGTKTGEGPFRRPACLGQRLVDSPTEVGLKTWSMRANDRRRVLWILNHTTLMEWEVPMLLAEGFEVFVPKVLPVGPNGRTATRSRAVVAGSEVEDSEVRGSSSRRSVCCGRSGYPEASRRANRHLV